MPVEGSNPRHADHDSRETSPAPRRWDYCFKKYVSSDPEHEPELPCAAGHLHR